jgi:hypothetical protein
MARGRAHIVKPPRRAIGFSHKFSVLLAPLTERRAWAKAELFMGRAGFLSRTTASIKVSLADQRKG